MLISHYLIFKNNYVLPNFNYGMPCYGTISTSSWNAPMTGFMENNRDDDDDDDDDGDDDLVSKLRMSGAKYPLSL